MPVDTDAPPTKQEENFRQAGLSKWMAGLQKELPNPAVGAGGQEPEPTPVPVPPEPAPTPATPPEVPNPPAQPPPAQPEPTDETRWPRSAKEWKNFTSTQKAKTDELQKQITQRDARIKELEAKTTATLSPETQKEIDSLKKENDEFSKQLRLVAVTNHPRFKNYFETKVNSTLAQLKYCVPADQLEAVTALVQQPDSDTKNERVEELLNGMNRLQQSRFVGVINGLNAIQAERDTEVARAQQDYDQMMAQAKAERESQHANFTKLLDDTVKGMQGQSGRPEYQLREGETEWNAAVQRRIDAGRKLITGNLPPEVMFKAAFDAAAYPDVLVGYKATLEENEKLRKQIDSMKAANPTVKSPTVPTNGTGTTPQMPKDSRPMDYTKRWVEQFGKAMRGE